ncbi:hypothetical protein IDG46_05665 [Staphylococcus sp. EG-SA-13]|nr:hypothetical protein [Staphylococcus sp. EG-SA-13]
MADEISIVRMRNQQTGEYQFPQTHVDGVIGVDDLIEEHINTHKSLDVILQAPTGQKFKLVIDGEGVLNTERLEE